MSEHNCLYIDTVSKILSVCLCVTDVIHFRLVVL